MKRVLFVDDESKILDGIRRMLYADRKRWEMEFAVGGEAALQACQAKPFDVVVSDMRMPVMDGATLLGRIRDLYPSTARIILSGYAEVALTTRAVPVAHRFLAKPCNATELQSTIERVCVLQDLLNNADIRRIVGELGELPSLSVTHSALTQAVADPNVAVKKIARIIEQDMAMTAKVLQLVNSAFFGLAQTVTSLQTAVTHLGMEVIKNLVLAADVFRVFSPDKRIPQSVCESMQRHAQSVATIAGRLPGDAKLRDLTVTAALLHDIGKLVLASKMPDQFCAALSLASQRGCPVFEAEEEVLGTSHAEIGGYLLGLWAIPQWTVEAIAHHHRPTRISHSGFDSSVTLYVADLLAHLPAVPEGGSPADGLRESDRACLDELGVLGQFAELHKLALSEK